MKNDSLLMPLFQTIDKLLFGIDSVDEMEKDIENHQSDNDDEYDVERSIN